MLPHIADELKEKLIDIRDIINDPSDIVHIQDMLDKIKVIIDEIDEDIMSLD